MTQLVMPRAPRLKYCPGCCRHRPSSQFTPDPTVPGGLKARCRKCRRLSRSEAPPVETACRACGEPSLPGYHCCLACAMRLRWLFEVGHVLGTLRAEEHFPLEATGELKDEEDAEA